MTESSSAVSPASARVQSSRTPRVRRSGHLSWRQFVILIGIALAGLLILLANVDAGRARAQVEVLTEKIVIDLDPELSGTVHAKINIPIQECTINGAQRLLVLDNSVLESASRMKITAAEGRASSLASIDIPAGWRFSLRIATSAIELEIFPGDEAQSSSGNARAAFKALPGSAFEEPGAGADHTWRVDGPVSRWATVIGPEGKPMTLLLYPTAEWRARTQFLGLEGVATTDLQFSDTRLSTNLSGESHILAASVQFADLETPTRPVYFREHLVASGWSGRLLNLAFVPADESSVTDVDPARRRPHLHARWNGEVSWLRAGYPGSGRSLLPSMLIKLAGTKQRLYITGVLIYLIIFLSAMIKQSPLGVGMLKHEQLMGGGA